jgi:predicted metal-binding membrane protein
MSMHSATPRLLPRVTPAMVVLLLIGIALVTWIVTVLRMRGMDAGPGTDLGGLGWFLGIWVTMMAAMMFPSAAPMVLLFQRVSNERAKKGQSFVPTWVFALSYLAVWTVYGLAAYGIYRALRLAGTGWLAWDGSGRYVAGGALLVAGLYELTPLKSVCLRHCRSPLHFLFGGWREGRLGAIRMGVTHGAYCVGCCWGLMVVLFTLGVMSLLWMAVVAALILAQKLVPHGEQLTRVFAVLFVGAGIWVASAPDSVPGLTQPNSDKADRARARMMGMTPGTDMHQPTMGSGSGPGQSAGMEKMPAPKMPQGNDTGSMGGSRMGP